MKHELRFGMITELYSTVTGSRKASALDLLDHWFPGLIVEEDRSGIRKEAVYDDLQYRIKAVRVNGRLYTGNDSRTIQIIGRLNGTAKGNQEKERKTAELIRKHLAYLIAEDDHTASDLFDHVRDQLAALDGSVQQKLCTQLQEYALYAAEERTAMDEYTRVHEPFPMDEEVFSRIVYNVIYQAELQTFRGLCCAWLWMLCGSLLRNEAGRVTRIYDSAWVPVFRETAETPALADKIAYLQHPEQYEYVYLGDDLDARFPGVEWYCDHCTAHLNDQPGFDDHRNVWVCSRCGCENRISSEEIYDSRQDWYSGRHTNDPAKFRKAIRRRRKEKRT